MKEAKAGAEAETMEEHCSLACSSGSYLGSFWDNLPKGRTTHSEPGPPLSIITQENVPQTSQQANLIEAFE